MEPFILMVVGVLTLTAIIVRLKKLIDVVRGKTPNDDCGCGTCSNSCMHCERETAVKHISERREPAEPKGSAGPLKDE